MVVCLAYYLSFFWIATRYNSYVYHGVHVHEVKQDCVVSPILCIVCIDELIVLLKNSGFGCEVGSEFIGILGYADHLTLICPSLNALNHMLSICTDFGKQYNIVFNAQKTTGIKFDVPVTQQDCIYS